MKRQIPIYLTILFIAVGLTHCVKYEEFPDTPQIKLLNFDLIYSIDQNGKVDTTLLDGVLKYEFTDGDGNFGTSSIHDTNVFVKYYRMDQGTLVPVVVDVDGEDVTIEYPRRVETLPVSANQGYLKGTIWDTIQSLYDFESYDFDTISLELYIVDQEGNKSNVESTGLLIIDRGNN